MVQWLLWLLIGLRLLGGLWFWAFTPLWEPLDEINHFDMAHFIAREGRLPTWADYPPVPEDWYNFVQYDQPPVYYGLLAVFLAPVQGNAIFTPPQAAAEPLCADTPHQAVMHLTSPDQVRAGWVARAVTVLVGAAAVWVMYRAAYAITRRSDVALLAAALLALHPAAVALSTWINNDSLQILTGGLLLWTVARVSKPAAHLRDWAAFAGAVLLALFTKPTGLVALPLALIVLWWRFVRWRPRRWLLLIGLAALLLLAYGLLNWVQCESLLCRSRRDSHYFDSWVSFVYYLGRPNYAEAFAHLLRTSTVPAMNRNDPVPDALLFIGLLPLVMGIVGSLFYRRPWRYLEWALVMIGLSLGLALVRVWWFPFAEGYLPFRYLALSVPAWVLLIAVGWDRLARAVGVVRLTLLAPLLLGGTLLLIPPLVYQPLAQRPDRMTQLPDNAVMMSDVAYNDGVQIVGYMTTDTGLRLFLQASAPVEAPAYLVVTLYDAAGNPLAHCGDTVGTALYPAPRWSVGEIVAQDFRLNAMTDAVAFDAVLYPLLTPHYMYTYTDFDRPQVFDSSPNRFALR